MGTLKDIIDYETAPVKQWEPVVGEAPMPGKLREDFITHNAVMQELFRLNAQDVTGIIADEARQEILIAAQNHRITRVTHLTLPGAFAMAAQHNLDMAQRERRQNVEKVRIETDIGSVRERSQDAVVLNMILGCLAPPSDHRNIQRILSFAKSLLRPLGDLIIVRPNPEGGSFETYECVTPANNLKAGDNYKFIVRGLEGYGPMDNLYTPDDFLRRAVAKAGFKMGDTKPVYSQSPGSETSLNNAPFLMNVCELR